MGAGPGNGSVGNVLEYPEPTQSRHVCNPSVPTVVWEAKTGESPEAGEPVSLHAIYRQTTRETLLQSERQGPMLEDIL